VEQVKIENDSFKCIKLNVIEYAGSGSLGKKFCVKCRYLKTDARIDKKIMKARRNSCVMITGELICINSEFQIDIQDINFLSTSISNIESSTTSTNISSLYSWSATNQTSGRITAQAMANTSQENADQNQNEFTNTDNNNEDPTEQDDDTLDSNEENSNNTKRNYSSKRKRKSRK